MDRWEVSWIDAEGKEHREQFAIYLDAWMFIEESLKGRGEIVLVTDRVALSSAHTARTQDSGTHKALSEAEEARRREGVRRYPRKKG